MPGGDRQGSWSGRGAGVPARFVARHWPSGCWRRWPSRRPPRRRPEGGSEARGRQRPGQRVEAGRRDPLPGGATVYRFQQRVSGVKVLERPGGGQRPERRAARLGDRLEQAEHRAPARRRALGRAPAIAGRLAQRRREAPARALVGAGLAIQPGDGGTLVWRRHPRRPAPGRLRGSRRRRLGPCGAHPGPAPALEARPRAALQPEPGGREQRLLGAARATTGQEHRAC